MDPLIIDRGRGPEIAGTRITVYDVLDYVEGGWHSSAIATLFRISTHEVNAATAYIEAHKEEVLAEYQKILDRAAQGNPPEIQAWLDGAYARMKARASKQKESNGQ